MTVKIKNTKGNLSSRVLILIFVLLALGILVAGHFFIVITQITTRHRSNNSFQLLQT